MMHASAAPFRRRRPVSRAVAGAAALLTVALLAGCGSDAGAEPVRSYEVAMHISDDADVYKYVLDEPADIRVGDEVTFVITNSGSLPHDVQITDASGTQLAVADPVPSGGIITATVHFEEAGRYRVACLVDDHLTVHQMYGVLEVTA